MAASMFRLVHCISLAVAAYGSNDVIKSSANVSGECITSPSVTHIHDVALNQSLLPFVLDLSVKRVLNLFVGHETLVKFNLTSMEPHQTNKVSLHVEVPKHTVAIAMDSEIILDWLEDDRSSGRLYNFRMTTAENDTSSWSGSFSIKGVGIGHALAMLSVTYYNTTMKECRSQRSKAIPLSVLRAPRMVDLVFQIMVYVLVISSGIASALKIDLQAVKEALKRPKAPIIGFCSQFIIMPLVSFGLIMLKGYAGGRALGLFALGTGPGGGQSNLYTLLLDGDVSISITMTLISTFACLGMMPLWMYTLGTTLPGNEHVSAESIAIPFVNILTTIAIITVPASIGLLIRWKLPRCSAKVIKWMNPPLLLVTVGFIGLALYTNWFVFSLLDADTLLSCAILPYGGFLLGGLVAFAARFERKLIMTIAIETGINNVGVAVVLVQRTLPQPDADLSLVPIIAAQLMTPLPLLLAVIVYTIYKRCSRRKDPDGAGKDDRSGEKETGATKRSGINRNGRESGGGGLRRDDIEEGVSLVGAAEAARAPPQLHS